MLDVRFGPLFVRDNPVFENKSPLKSSISQIAFRAFADAALGLRFLGVRLATGRAGDVPIRRIGALLILLKTAHEEKGDQKMRYLIEMKLSGSARPKDPQDGIFLIERYILPSLEICRKWQAEGKLLAGGPVSASIQLAFVLEVESVPELDAQVESLPLSPLMETSVTPLTTFEGRIQAVQSKLKQLKSLLQEPACDIEGASQ